MTTLALLFAGASLGLSGLVILWGIAWAAHPRKARSVIPTVHPQPYSNSSTLVPLRGSGRVVDSEA